VHVAGKNYRQFGDSSELRQLTRDMIRWDCRPFATMQPPPLGYFVKFTVECVAVLPMLQYESYSYDFTADLTAIGDKSVHDISVLWSLMQY